MSEAVEIVSRFGALVASDLPGDAEPASAEERFAEILSMLHPEFEMPVASSLPYGGVHIGVDGFLAMGGEFAKTWNVLDNSGAEFIDAGDGRVVALYSPTFQSLETDETVSFKMVEILTVRDGKIASLVPYYFDTVELLKVLGKA